MNNTNVFGLTALLAMSFMPLTSATGATISWLDVSLIPGANSAVITDPILGRIQVTTDTPAQAIFAGPAGSLGSLVWEQFAYINYDASTTGTNAPITGTMTFQFLDGPIDTSVTQVYFSSNGLAAASSYTIDNAPIYLGDIGILEGPGTHTPLGGGLLRIDGAGFNHNPDLFLFGESSISSISVDVDQVLGDGAGFAIGVAVIPLPAALWLLISACLVLGGIGRPGVPGVLFLRRLTLRG